MKIIIGTFAVLAMILGPGAAHAGPAPREIAGIGLGTRIDQVKDLLRMETAMPIRHAGYLTVVDVKPMEGYQGGSVTYGNCQSPGRIVRVKLRYDRDDKQFFDELFKRFQERFGDTSEYKGDAFRMFQAWKWSFTDEQGNRVSLILQHNSMDDDDFPSGNIVKLSDTSDIEKERACYDRLHPSGKDTVRVAHPGREKDDFGRLVPR